MSTRGALLDDVKRGSSLLEQQLLRLIDWIGDRKIVSFVEMQQTKKLQKVRLQVQSPADLRLMVTLRSNLTEPGLGLGSISISSVMIQAS